MATPVIRAAGALLFHTPGLVAFGAKPAAEVAGRVDALAELRRGLRSHEGVIRYAPNQVFIGNFSPWELQERPRPWHSSPLEDAKVEGPHGAIFREEELYTWLLLADEFNLITPRPEALEDMRAVAATSPLVGPREREALAARRAREAKASPADLSLCLADGREVASIRSDHERDACLQAGVLLENLVAKATGALALRWLLLRSRIDFETVDYVIGCSEDAVGDRYQRGGGNLGKAMAELAGCRQASGADVKDFCASPLAALVMGASLVHAGIFRLVAVVGGGSLPKLGMKYRPHLAKGHPVLEDVLGATVILITADDGESPVLRLDSVRTHRVGDDNSPIGLAEALVSRPLKDLGLRYDEVDRYVGELHNPDITVPAGGDDVPEKNTRMIAACAVADGQLTREGIAGFVRAHGVPGFAPTQGQVASAVCFMPHAIDTIRTGAARRLMFIAKASCFLGRMTQLANGVSFLLEGP